MCQKQAKDTHIYTYINMYKTLIDAPTGMANVVEFSTVKKKDWINSQKKRSPNTSSVCWTKKPKLSGWEKCNIAAIYEQIHHSDIHVNVRRYVRACIIVFSFHALIKLFGLYWLQFFSCVLLPSLYVHMQYIMSICPDCACNLMNNLLCQAYPLPTLRTNYHFIPLCVCVCARTVSVLYFCFHG